MKKKLLFIGPYPPPYGGIASHLREFVKYLQRIDYIETHIITGYTKNKRHEDNFHAQICSFSPRRRIYLLLNPINVPFIIRSIIILKKLDLKFLEIVSQIIRAVFIKDYVKKYSIDLISIMDSWQMGFVIPILKSSSKWSIPIVFTAWGVSKNVKYFHKRKNMLQRIIALSDMVWATSDYCARGVEMIGMNSNKIQTIYVGVDIERFSGQPGKVEVRRKLHLPLKCKIALFVGRMNEEMGLDVLLDIIPSIIESNDDINFLLTGADSNLSEKAKELERRYPEKVYVHINASFEELTQYYKACDILLAPTISRHACMGVSIKEAMASGRPAVASNSGGIPEAIVDGKTGIIVRIIDEKINRLDFKKSILLLLKDETLRTEMGTKAKQRAIEIFANEITCSKLLKSYNELLSN